MQTLNTSRGVYLAIDTESEAWASDVLSHLAQGWNVSTFAAASCWNVEAGFILGHTRHFDSRGWG